MSMNLNRFAARELNRLKIDKPRTELDKKLNNAILKLIEEFADLNVRGFESTYILSAFKRLSHWKPLTPLTGEDNEWKVVSGSEEDPILWQNYRCPSVFKDEKGAYDTEAIVFSKDGGKTWFKSKDSQIRIEFPYNVPDEPHRIVIKTDDEELLKEADYDQN